MAPKKTKREANGAQLGLRIDAEDVARLDALLGQMMMGTRHGLAKIALRLGLDAIEKDRTILVGGSKRK